MADDLTWSYCHSPRTAPTRDVVRRALRAQVPPANGPSALPIEIAAASMLRAEERQRGVRRSIYRSARGQVWARIARPCDHLQRGDMDFRLKNDVRPAGWSLAVAAALIATTFVAGVVAAVVKSDNASRGQECNFASTTSVATPLMVAGSDFRLSLPDGWAWIEPHAADLDAQVQKAAAADARLRAFFLATSRTASPGARIIAADPTDLSNHNILLETAQLGLRLDSPMFGTVLRVEVESEGFAIRSLATCDFQHATGRARYASYKLTDTIQGGGKLEARVAFVETKSALWDLTTFGTNGPELDRNLLSIVRSFRA